MATYARKLKDGSGNYVAPATVASAVYIGDAKLTDDFTVAMDYNGWTSQSDGSFKKVFTCANMKANYQIWDWKAGATGTPATDEIIRENLGYISTITPSDGQVTIICNTTKPTIKFTLHISIKSAE